MSALSLPILPEAAHDKRIVAAAAQLGAEALGPRDIRYVRTLRISVTDHCNFRCIYCMPEEGVTYLPREEVLTYEEMVEIARAAISHGIRNFKLTGGEPLLRKDLTALVRMLRELPGCGEISLTTNGLLLEQFAEPLRAAGVERITVSLDTLDPDRFRSITRTGDLSRVWRGIAIAEACGLGPAKINVVVMRDHNLDELVDFARLTLSSARTIRFIEFMPLGKSKLLMDDGQFVSYQEIRGLIEDELGILRPAAKDVGSGPARVFQLPDAPGRIGFIHAMSAPFCSTCNRLRLTPEGQLRSCLFDGGEVDVRPFVRPSTDVPALRRAFVDCVVLKPDQHKHYGNRAMSSIGG
jgi:cyclic pyranopterin phosphate synthase